MGCNCWNMCRDASDEGYSALLPLSENHPNCEEYELVRMIRVELDGSIVIVTPKESQAFQDSDENYILSEFFATQDQLDKLPEFQGF